MPRNGKSKGCELEPGHASPFTGGKRSPTYFMVTLLHTYKDERREEKTRDGEGEDRKVMKYFEECLPTCEGGCPPNEVVD